MKINLYQTSSQQLPKSFCQILEKCFYSEYNSLVLMQDLDLMQVLDKSLWTYSKKHFLAHATMNDPEPQKQPIFITNKIENPNDSRILVFVNPGQEFMLSAFAQVNKISTENFQKILLITDSDYENTLDAFKDAILKSKFKDADMKAFSQDVKGAWVKI